MITLRLALVAAAAGIFMMLTGSLAHAAVDPYPVETPTPTIAPDDEGIAPDDEGIAPDDESDEADDNGVLPGTGGASLFILLAGGALVVVGGAVVYSSRRRHQSAH